MKKKPDPGATELRRQSEAKLRKRNEKDAAPPATKADTRRLVHEIEVHQIELEMQNTELTQSRYEVEELLHQYADLYDFAPVGYFMLTSDGAIRKTNLAGADLLGVERGQLIDRRFGLFLSVESRPAFSAFLEKVFSTRGSKETGEVILLKDWTHPIWAHIEATCLEDEQECSAVLVDITARKRAEMLLKDTNQRLEQAVSELQTKSEELANMRQQLWQVSKLTLMGELAASIAHELNNPLATVALGAESLLARLPVDGAQARLVEVILREAERMGSLVSNLLQFSRRSHRQISFIDLREELRNSLEFIQYYLRSHKIDIVQEFAGDLPTVQADRQQFREVFLNLLTNASDAMPEGGILTVRAIPGTFDNGMAAVVCEFSDTGIGIEEENLPKIWEPFFTTKPEGKGTGLGLPICRRMVEGHHGTIEIESTTGKGTMVRITLPATEKGAAGRE